MFVGSFHPVLLLGASRTAFAAAAAGARRRRTWRVRGRAQATAYTQTRDGNPFDRPMRYAARGTALALSAGVSRRLVPFALRFAALHTACTFPPPLKSSSWHRTAHGTHPRPHTTTHTLILTPPNLH